MRAHWIMVVAAAGMMTSGANAATRSSDALPVVSKVAVQAPARLVAVSKVGQVGECRQLVKGKLDSRAAKKAKCSANLAAAAGAPVVLSSTMGVTALQAAIAAAVVAGTAFVVVDANGTEISRG